jgi:hypothetical protein
MKKTIFFACLLSSTAFGSTTLSPYADITLNTHWDSEAASMQPADLSKIGKEAGLKAFHLAFITDAGHCEPTWGGQAAYPLRFAKRLVDNLHKEKIETTLSFGGANGNDLSMNCSPQALTNILNTASNTLQTEKLDFDIENGTANIDTTMEAINTFQASHPHSNISFTLPTMPEGLTNTGKDIVQKAVAKKIKFSVNVMAMDYGPSYAGNMAAYAIQSAVSLFSYLKTLYPAAQDKVIWKMVGVTPMIGVNDVNIEHFTLDDANKLSSFAKNKELGLLSFWSITRDKPCSDKWASPICSGQNLQKSPYDYANAFIRAEK